MRKMKRMLALLLCLLIMLMPFDMVQATEEMPTPTPTQEESTPTPTVEAPTPTPTVEEPTPTPTVEEPTPTPTVEAPTPTPTADEPTPTPTVEAPTPTPTADEPTPTPTVEAPTPTPVMEEPGPELLTMSAASVDDFHYSIANGKVTITSYIGSSADVVIPDTIEGYPVTAIGEEAFYQKDNIHSVTFPNSIQSVGAGAFFYCKNLVTVVFSSELTSIGDLAFHRCRSLKDIILPAKLKTIGERAFTECVGLGSINIPASVTSIGSMAFTDAGLMAFSVDAGSKSYASVDGVLFNKQLTTLIAYPRYRPATAYSVPSGMEEVFEYAFVDADNLVSIALPNSMKAIRRYAFLGCGELVNINLPTGLNTLGVSTFEACESLISIEIPDTITEIPIQVFVECPSLTKVTIPASVTSIGEMAFNYISNLTIYGYAGSYAQTYAANRGISFVVISAPAPTPTPTPAPQSVSLNRTSITIGVGQAVSALNATVNPAKANQQIQWSSSNSAVVSVSSTGRLTGKAVGRAVVRATAVNGRYKECTVTVIKRGMGVVGIVINKTKVSVDEGKTVTLTARITPSSAQNKTVTWTSSKPSVASVDSRGKVKGLLPGTAVITATASSGVSAQCSVTVKSLSVTKVVLSKSTLQVDEGQTAIISASVQPANARYKTVTFKSSNPSIASVSSTGKITTYKAGTVKITATAHNGVSATCTLTVRSLAVTKITLNKTTLSVKVSRYFTLKAYLLPKNARFKTIVWTSSDPAIATVSSSGRVTGRRPGTAVITAVSHNGLTAKCTVTVTK